MAPLLSAGNLPPNRHDDLEEYGVNGYFEDPFATPSPPSSPKKRKAPSQGLGIDEEVAVAKRARVPNVKLDEDRLLGQAGLPTLRQRARNLKIKGKGHEFGDAARLLSFYQMWLDDLFPKAKFLDALAMVEKAGHKKRVVVARNELMNEGKPRTGEDEAQDVWDGVDGAETHVGDVPQGEARPRTPIQDVPDDEDIYDATPRGVRHGPLDAVPGDEDDLEALVAEAGDYDAGASDSRGQQQQVPSGEGTDDLDALIEEAEAEDRTGHDASGRPNVSAADGDFGDEEAAMQDIEGF